MDLVWWETRGFDGWDERPQGLFGNESDRRKTPTILGGDRDETREREIVWWFGFEMV